MKDKDYVCPDCGSGKITIHNQYGQLSWSCRVCHHWGKWIEPKELLKQEPE